jgi:DNA-binding PadR family transcriptional regulator
MPTTTPEQIKVLSDPLALDICVAARSQPAASAYELGKAVARPQGSLKRVLPKLMSAGALRERRDRRGAREVKVFLFNEDWAEAVQEVVRGKSLGRLQEGQRVFLVGTTGVEAVARLLRDERFKDQVGWVVEFDDSALALAIVLREEADRSVSSALLPALRRLGLRQDGDALRLLVGRTFDQVEISLWTREILDGPGTISGEISSGWD